MSGLNIPYEEKRFMMEFLNIWNRYGKPPITLHTDNLHSTDRGSGKIIGLQHRFVDEVLEVADILQVNVQLECLGIRGSWGTPVMEADGDDEDETEENDAPTDYSAEDQEPDENDSPTDYSAQSDDTEDDGPTDYGAEEDAADDGGGEEAEAEEGGEEEQGEEGDDTTGADDDGEEAGGDETGDDTGSMEEDAPTDYSADAGDDMGEEGGDSESGDDSGSKSDDSSSSDEQTDSSNVNTLVKNFSLMGDFENLYSLITDSINTLNSTLKADPGQNRVLVQVSRNLSSIKDFILTFIQFHFKNDNYQYNLYYYEVVIHLLKLNLAMLEKALTLGDSKQEKKSKEVNKNG